MKLARAGGGIVPWRGIAKDGKPIGFESSCLI